MDKIKAYIVDLNKIQYGYEHQTHVVYANNIKEARYGLLKEYMYNDLRLKYSDDDEDLTYITIPVIRAKEHDKQLYDGEWLTPNVIYQKKYEKERNVEFDNILNDNSITHCYIKKGPYYCPNWGGYTDHRTKAGIYLKDEAVKHARSVNEIQLYPIDIKEHNLMIMEEINNLRSRLIEKPKTGFFHNLARIFSNLPSPK